MFRAKDKWTKRLTYLTLFVYFLVQMKTLKFVFEIYWLLAFLFHVPEFSRDIYKIYTRYVQTVKVEEMIRENNMGECFFKKNFPPLSSTSLLCQALYVAVLEPSNPKNLSSKRQYTFVWNLSYYLLQYFYQTTIYISCPMMKINKISSSNAIVSKQSIVMCC